MPRGISVSLGREGETNRYVWLVLAVLTLMAGIGVWYLDRFDTPYKGVVQQNISVFVCCIPSTLLALIFFLLAFSTEKKAEKKEVAHGDSIPTCPKCGSVRLNHRLDGKIECNECHYEW